MGKKKNKAKKISNDNVASYLVAAQSEENRTIEVQTEMVGKGIGFLVTALITPLIPAVITNLQAVADHRAQQVRLEEGRQQIENEKASLARARLAYDGVVQQSKDRREDRREEAEAEENLRAASAARTNGN